MMVGLNSERIIQAINILKSSSVEGAAQNSIPLDYKSKNVSKKVVKIIHSYTDYVNQRTWRK